MNTQFMKVLAINSLPANGNAGMKMVMHVLGTRVIPVPSLLLTGIGSLSGFEKFPIPFKQMLSGTLALAKRREEALIVYIGYLGNADQISIINESLQQYKDIVKYIIVDPVCGDHGKAYVPREIIANWGTLIESADLCLPNVTEAALLSGYTENYQKKHAENYLKAFRKRFPNTALLATSIEQESYLINRLYKDNTIVETKHKKQAKNYGGSGDAFASYLINAHFYKTLPLEKAIYTAGEAVRKAISYSFENGQKDLMLSFTTDL
ncbi:MAG: bifunctional hydroxymethylpyrimidine kinase/phosphomethylpyrimidine kinase [Bacteroidota bacterium]